MSEQLENSKSILNNIQQCSDIKDNPVVKATILSVLKAIPVIGELIDSTIDVVLSEFQLKKEKNC